MALANGIKWEKVDLPSNPRTANKCRVKTITLTGGRNKERPNCVTFSPDLTKAIGLKSGDGIWLFKYGNLFMIKKDPTSDYKVKYTSKAAKSLSLCYTIFVDNLYAFKNGRVFDAWIEEDAIVFKKKGEDIAI